MSSLKLKRSSVILVVNLVLLSLSYGKNVEKLTSRIIGGRDARNGEMPCVLAVEDPRIPHLGSICTYCLINEQTAIGCAHCLYHGNSPVPGVVLKGGEVNRYEGKEFKFKDLIIHEKYNPSTQENDISLIILENRVTTRYNLKPVFLPMPGEEYIGMMARVAGWGYTDFSRSQPATILQKLEVKILPHANCRSVWSEYKRKTDICAGVDGANLALHDSGSPLVISDEYKQVIVGITSKAGGSKMFLGKPALFVSVNKYIPWIQKRAVGNLKLAYIKGGEVVIPK